MSRSVAPAPMQDHHLQHIDVHNSAKGLLIKPGSSGKGSS